MIFEIDIILRLLSAALLGGLIGYEREQKQRPAGFRTHILVCIGAALVMIISEYMLKEFTSGTDPARMGAQVISGIGFLGAGTIIRDKFKVKGLTTAASLWAVACIGLAVGMGYFYLAGVAFVVIFITLRFLSRLEKKAGKEYNYANIKITAHMEEDIEKKVTNDIKEFGYDIKKMNFSKTFEDSTVVFIFLVSHKTGVEWEDVSLHLFKKEYIRKATLDY
ncbi:MAG: MgtC/SapB family protein [Clostridia bacterium]|nr:MgtC/SapB family protein [Clostridia bacterium]